MKSLLISLILISSSFANYAYTYGQKKGQIDMHGGKGDTLNSSKGFSNSLGLGSSLNKKETKEETKENKKYIPIENIEKIKPLTK